MSDDLARIGNEELDSPGELVLSCGLRVSRLKAQLDRIEAALGLANRLIVLPDGESNRWAAFTDDELENLHGWMLKGMQAALIPAGATWVFAGQALHDEIESELERRQS